VSFSRVELKHRFGHFILLPGIAILLLSLASTNTARATILLFDQERDAATQSIVGPTGSGGTLPADYGDHVTSAVVSVPGGVFTYGEAGEGYTPNVSLDIFSAEATETNPRVNLWQDGYGDLVNVIFAEGPGTAGAPLLSVRLTAETGYMVDLYGFDLAGFNTDYTIAGVSVFAGATTLFSEADILVQGDQTGPGHTTFAFDPPFSAPELLLQIDLSNLPSGIQDNVALDNLRFGQNPPGIPEPGTLLLATLAAAALFIRRARTSLPS
jgi:hypothetical protein